MIIDLNLLNIKKEIDINYDVLKDEELDKRIIDLKASKVVGKIYNNDYEIVLDCVFKGTMIIIDSITLKEIPYDFAIHIEENLEEIKENYLNCYKTSENILDLKTILWQNIVLEVPISYTLENDAKLSGNGWKLVNDEEEVKGLDPRLEKLKELLER